MNLLLGVTGSVSTIKLIELIATMERKAKDNLKSSLNIQVIATKSALQFLDVSLLKPSIILHTKESPWDKSSNFVHHIHLRNWADVLCIAPLTANTLAKLANGLCNNLLTSVCRAWDFEKNACFLVFPAMNTCMWNHPITQKQVKILTDWNIKVIHPIVKNLACGTTGIGGLPDVEDIANELITIMQDLQKNIVVS